MAYKEIVTKAVIGKGKKTYKDNYAIEVPNKPTTVLGCWIINHTFSGKKENDKVIIKGSYDANIWYSYDSDTKTNVINKKIDYTIEERINVNNTNTTNEDIIIRALKQPTCIKAKEDGNIINIEIEKELGIEVIGDTFVKVNSVEEEDTWDILENNEEINIEYIKPTHEEEK